MVFAQFKIKTSTSKFSLRALPVGLGSSATAATSSPLSKTQGNLSTASQHRNPSNQAKGNQVLYAPSDASYESEDISNRELESGLPFYDLLLIVQSDE